MQTKLELTARASVAVVALVHFAFAIMEMLFWRRPVIHRRLGFSQGEANKAAPVVANAGLYNAFLASGLTWSIFASEATALRLFLLGCVALAGLFGAATLKRTTLLLQTLPAVVAGALVWFASAAR